MQSQHSAITAQCSHPPRSATPPATAALQHLQALTFTPHPTPAFPSSPHPSARRPFLALPPGKPRNHPHPARSLVEVIALCNHCTLQSPLPHHLHPANSPSRQLPDKSKSQQVEKLASWQTPPPSSSPCIRSHPPNRVARLNVPSCPRCFLFPLPCR